MEISCCTKVLLRVALIYFLFAGSTSGSTSEVLRNVQVTVDSSAPQLNCTESKTTENRKSFLCPSLQTALQLTGSTGGCCYHYFISFRHTASSGGFIHLITEPIVTSASVTLNSGGSESDNVTISCHIAQEILTKPTYDLKYILYFNSSLYVNFRYTIFEYCPLPIRILKAEQVEITNSTFRLDIIDRVDEYEVIGQTFQFLLAIAWGFPFKLDYNNITSTFIVTSKKPSLTYTTAIM